MRKADKKRKTAETNIELILNIDGKGKSDINTGIGFMDHMLTLLAKHGLFDIKLKCKGDLDVDFHHTVEDIGIVLGTAFKEALGTKEGIRRYSDKYTPMDESLCLVVIDISGRPHLSFNVNFEKDKVGVFDTELIKEFFLAFVNTCGMTLHIKKVYGENTHHIIEAVFKGFGRTLDEATQIDSRIDGILSTKGVI